MENVPQNTFTLLKTNRRFIESFMLGLNHEFASELLWRDYPTDMRGTYFQQFWDEAEGEALNEEQKDIDEIVNWKESLGKNEFNERTNFQHDDENTVLLIRGDLLKRYPNTRIYIVKANPADNTKPDLDLSNAWFPIFDGQLPPDIVFLVYKISPTMIENGDYFIVLEERIGKTRFGLDESFATENPNDVSNLSWKHFSESIIEKEQVLNDNIPTANIPDGWSESSSGEVASYTLQLPARVIIHASRLIPENK